MPWKIYEPEEIIVKLRQAEVLTSQGWSEIDAIRSSGGGDTKAATPLAPRADEGIKTWEPGN